MLITIDSTSRRADRKGSVHCRRGGGAGRFAGSGSRCSSRSRYMDGAGVIAGDGLGRVTHRAVAAVAAATVIRLVLLCGLR